jgi:hypothetical protein
MFDDPPGLSGPTPPSPGPESPVAASAAELRFKSCRWRAQEDQGTGSGDYCTHRDVLPFAGTTGFKPESWCPECAFYKLRRSPKKRDPGSYTY